MMSMIASLPSRSHGLRTALPHYPASTHPQVRVRFGSDATAQPPANAGTATTKLPPFTHEGYMFISLLSNMEHPAPAKTGALINLIKILTASPDLTAYLNKQGSRAIDIYRGVDEQYLPSLRAKMLEKKRTPGYQKPFYAKLNDDEFEELKQSIRRFAQQNGLERVNPITIWHWLLKEDKDNFVRNVLVESGLTTERIAAMKNLPIPKPEPPTPPGGVIVASNKRPTRAQLETMEKGFEKVPRILVGQKGAVRKIMEFIQERQIGYKIEDEINEHPNKPDCNILILGPSGVGKTLLGKTLAHVLERPLVSRKMNEYKDSQSIRQLLGAGPGYVGYGKKSLASDMIDANENTQTKGTNPPVVLFDEIEKMDDEAFEVLMQAYDEGELQSGTGETASFKNTIILNTSNLAQDKIKQAQAEGKSPQEIEKIVNEALEGRYKPEQLGRFDLVVVFESLTEDDFRVVLERDLEKLKAHVKDVDHINLAIDLEAVNQLHKAGYSRDFGIRHLKRTIKSKLLSPLAQQRKQLILQDKLTDRPDNGTYFVKPGDNGQLAITYQPPAEPVAQAAEPPPTASSPS